MTAVFHPDVQRDVSAILRHYDRINPRLGDEFWTELMAFVERATAQPGRFHFDPTGRRRVNLRRFPYHFLFREIPGAIRITVVRHNRQSPQTGAQRR
jgi:plasmid stabilization system protein ParE